MTLFPWLGYALSMAALPAIARTWVRFKADRRARKAFAEPLFETFLLDVALTPRDKDGDDENVLAEIKETLSQLNRQSFAAEFWTLDRQLTAYYDRIPTASRPTMRRALVRLIASGNRWLQIVGAKTSADLSFVEAIPPLQSLLNTPAGQATEPNLSVDEQFRQEIRAALERLSPKQPAPARS